MWIIKQNTSEKGLPQENKNQNEHEEGKPHLKRIFFHYINFIFICYRIFSQPVSQEVTKVEVLFRDALCLKLKLVWELQLHFGSCTSGWGQDMDWLQSTECASMVF